MPPEITGPGGALGGVPIPPTAPVRPASPSRALVPVERTGPRAPAESPLGRSGVALEDLLFAPDLLETREALTPVAMELGLETARRQLLQRMPAESLESLDAVWGRAEGSEEGWYLRAGALTVLGHPQEGDRVAAEGLQSQPQSLALRLVQSVARALVGDLSGARATLYPALDTAPNDPVLLAQQAVVLARQGHDDDAADLLQQIADGTPDHPALLWATAAVRTAATDRTRMAARVALAEEEVPEWVVPELVVPEPVVPGTVVDGTVVPGTVVDGTVVPGTVVDEPIGADPLPPAADVPVDAVDSAAGDADAGDMVATAFRGLGVALRHEPVDAVIDTARMLLRACSAGGTLARACTPVEAHAARQVLSALLIVLRPEGPGPTMPGHDAPPLPPLMTQLLPLLRAERADGAVPDTVGAERVLRRFGAAVPPEVRHLLSILVEGADGGVRRVPDDDGIGELFPSEAELGPLVPVRLGLSLLAETSATRALEHRQEVLGAERLGPAAANAAAASGIAAGAVFVRTRSVPADQAEEGELSGTGWGGAAAAAGASGRGADGRPPVSSAAFPAILLVAAALGAALNGAALIAALLGGVGLWIALRARGPRR